jgi:hypothetical protein
MKKGALNERCGRKNASPAHFSAFRILHFAFRLRFSAALLKAEGLGAEG